MSPDQETLADLHRRFDGPIPDDLRDQALAGRLGFTVSPRQRRSRDIDRLALTTMHSLGRWRLAQAGDAMQRHRLVGDQVVIRLSRALHAYRDAGVALRRQR